MKPQFNKEMLNNNSLDSLISIIDRSFKIACLDKFDELDLTFHNYMTLEFIYNHENVIQKDLARLFHRNQSTITRPMINWKIKDLLKEFMMIIIKKKYYHINY